MNIIVVMSDTLRYDHLGVSRKSMDPHTAYRRILQTLHGL